MSTSTTEVTGTAAQAAVGTKKVRAPRQKKAATSPVSTSGEGSAATISMPIAEYERMRKELGVQKTIEKPKREHKKLDMSKFPEPERSRRMNIGKTASASHHLYQNDMKDPVKNKYYTEKAAAATIERAKLMGEPDAPGRKKYKRSHVAPWAIWQKEHPEQYESMRTPKAVAK